MALKKKSSVAIPHGIETALEVVEIKAMSGLATITGAEVNAELTVNVMAKDETGENVAHLFGDTKHTIKLDGHVDALALPALGAEVTYAGRSGAIVSSTINAVNEDFVKASVSAEGYVETGPDSYE